ncbi:MAG: hypothetical protein KDA46_11680, partial [Parvularculaceae bacterium]|nr:hypothetical protein [Parvularculaceae bacterium]
GMRPKRLMPILWTAREAFDAPRALSRKRNARIVTTCQKDSCLFSISEAILARPSAHRVAS